jgi:hypothetical protein
MQDILILDENLWWGEGRLIYTDGEHPPKALERRYIQKLCTLHLHP